MVLLRCSPRCALVLCSLLGVGPALFAQEPPRSPRLAALHQAVTAGDLPAVDAFWREVEQAHTPLVEPIHAEPHWVWLTFLFRGDQTTQNVVLAGGPAPGHPRDHQFTRLAQTDVWYRTVRMRDDLRTTYYLSPNDPLLPLDYRDRAAVEARVARLRMDPLNPRKDFAGSVVELAGAAPQPWVVPRAEVPKGMLHAAKFHSQMLDNDRRVTVYRPAAYREDGRPYPLLILFDLESYTLSVPTPTILNNLIHAGRLAPCVALLIGNTANGRSRELACNDRFVACLADELLPQIRRQHHVSEDPRQVVIAGSSLGGLAALHFAWRHPELAGNVICQSGSLNWCPEEDRLADDPALEGAWLTRQFVATPRHDTRFVLEAGLLESIRFETRRLRDVLLAKGYEVVRYSEYNGGHDYINWRGSLADGLMALLPPAQTSPP